MRTDRQTDWRDEANSRFSQFSERAWKLCVVVAGLRVLLFGFISLPLNYDILRVNSLILSFNMWNQFSTF